MFTSTLITLLLTVLSIVTGIHAVDECGGQSGAATYCTNLTFEDTTDTSGITSTNTTQCQATCMGVNEDAGDWEVMYGTDCSRDLMLGWPCGLWFGPAPGASCTKTFDMTNQDVLNILGGASDRFGDLHGGAFSAQGTATCQGVTTDWYIMHFDS
ncbi:hypothetical protein F5Y16DRAFT_398161 [Xylariaceae sp. FL0255]|nr:hypothetical protein F5Y16DRAFT_398161 [Xylariaceae sp. FL0255]